MGRDGDLEDAYTVWADEQFDALSESGLPPFALMHAQKCLQASVTEPGSADALDEALLEAAYADPSLLLAAARAMPVDSRLNRGSFAGFVQCVHEYGAEVAEKYGAYLPRMRDDGGERFGPEGAQLVTETMAALKPLCEEAGLGLVEFPLWSDVKRPRDGSLAHVGEVRYESVLALRRRGAGADESARALIACDFDPGKAEAVLFEGVAPAVVDGWL